MFVISVNFLLALQQALEKTPMGMSEYDLIQDLKSQSYFSFLSSPALPDELFQAHFILFHGLYLLRDKLIERKEFLLEITALNIQLFPYVNVECGIEKQDKLREYYLDITHLENTTSDDVYNMLAEFWSSFNKLENREEALNELGLKDPVDDVTIKKEYRRLAMKHHPDRGGDKGKLQKINAAINLLIN